MKNSLIGFKSLLASLLVCIVLTSCDSDDSNLEAAEVANALSRKRAELLVNTNKDFDFTISNLEVEDNHNIGEFANYYNWDITGDITSDNVIDRVEVLYYKGFEPGTRANQITWGFDTVFGINQNEFRLSSEKGAPARYNRFKIILIDSNGKASEITGKLP